ncbi:hypothetical protein [Methyloceanibacter sp.]|uniref:hypothetical protein n=1 Tax=Methyloceanibacter sp. TaxID=1965321 RepID=UPI003D6D63DE
MKRPHRSIETFDISLMAVVTKAMGAFLVLMLLLMPYYSSSPLGKDEAQDLARKVQDADAKIKGVLDKLGDKDLGKDLVSAREELGSGEKLIGQLKRYVDQLSAQVTRLEEKIVTLSAELDQLKKDKSTLSARVAELEKENADLKAENEKLKAEIEELKKRIAELEKQIKDLNARIAELEKKIEELNKRIAELEKSEPEKVEELKKQIEELKKEIARLKQQVEDLNARVAALEDENARLRARNAELEQQVAQLNALVAPLQEENAQLKAKIAELEKRLSEVQQANAKLEAQPVLAGDAQSADCSSFTIGAFSATMTTQGQKHVLNFGNGFGVPFQARRLGGRYVSMFVASGLQPSNRYFLFLLSRKEEQRGDEPRAGLSHHADGGDQPNDGGGQPSEPQRESPLQPPAKSCVAIVSMVFSAANRAKSRIYQVVFDPGQPVQYFGDAITGSDWDAHFADPSPEGQAWLKDQLAHADIVPAEAPPPGPGAGGAPQGAPAGAPPRFEPRAGRAPQGGPAGPAPQTGPEAPGAPPATLEGRRTRGQ